MRLYDIVISISVLFALLFVLLPSEANPGAKKAKAQTITAQATAQKAAKSWLALVDAGNYRESWNTAASSLQSALTKVQWSNAMQSAHGPLGKVLSRKLKSIHYKKALQVAVRNGKDFSRPELKRAPYTQEFVTIIYTVFAAHRAAAETVTLTPNTDGKWQVSSYFIK